MPTPEDMKFSAAALRGRLVSQHQAHKAMRLVEQSEERGKPQTISDVMVARDHLRPEQRDAVLGEVGLRTARCNSCGAGRLVAADSGDDLPCPHCATRPQPPGLPPTQPAAVAHGPRPAPQASAEDAEQEDRLVGREIHPFRFLELIGRGGMASVYRGENMDERRVSAIKILDKTLAEEDPDFIPRFLREGRSLAELNHPNIVSVFNTGEVAGLHFIEMQYVPGPTLRQVLDRLGRLTPAEAVAVTIPVLRALTFAHARRVIHRDIKPDNIMITPAGEVKVTDFGVAKDLSETTQFTHSGFVMGTPLYMSPEQCAGQAVDGRADIYSLGLTLYHVLSGVCPHAAESPLAVMHLRRSTPLTDLHQECHDVPGPLSDVIAVMTQIDPQDRFANAQAAAGAFLELRASGVVRKVSARRMLKGNIERRPPPHPPTVEAPRAPPPSTKTASDLPRPPRRKRILLIAAAAAALLAAGVIIWLTR